MVQVSGKTSCVGLLAVLVAVAASGCQSSPYRGTEDRVFNHFNPWSEKVPKGLVPARAQQKGDRQVYAYYDPGAGPGGDQSKRVIRCEIGPTSKELAVSDATPQRKNKPSFFGFYAGEREMSLPGGIAADRIYVLQDEAHSVAYLREKGTGLWRSCQLDEPVWMSFTPDKQARCIEQGQPVSAERVRRYQDLAKRFYKTYFFME